ncbi:MAG: AAA+ family ATPase [Pseudomonadota bacterium]
MKQLVVILLFALPLPALAQEDAPDEPLLPFLEDFAERTEELMRDFMEDMTPEMERLMAEVMPRLQSLTDALGGLSAYEMPEVLPNGDIIIRRKPDAPDLPEDFLDEQNNPIDL